MFYGIYNKKPALPIIVPYFLTRHDVFNDGDMVPWLTTRKSEAVAVKKSLLPKFPGGIVEIAMVSCLASFAPKISMNGI